VTKTHQGRGKPCDSTSVGNSITHKAESEHCVPVFLAPDENLQGERGRAEKKHGLHYLPGQRDVKLNYGINENFQVLQAEIRLRCLDTRRKGENDSHP